MKKSSLLLVFLLCMAVFSTVQATAPRKGTLQIEIKGLSDEDKLIVSIGNLGAEDCQRDTMTLKNGKISFESSEVEVVSLFILKRGVLTDRGHVMKLQSMTIESLVIPGVDEKIKATLTDRCLEYRSEGSEYHKTRAEERMKNMYLTLRIDSLNTLIEQAYLTNPSEEEYGRWFEERGEASRQMRTRRVEYIKNNPNTLLASEYLCRIGYDEMITLEPTVAEEFRNGFFKKLIDENLLKAKQLQALEKASESIKEGNNAPDFELLCSDGSMKRLSDFRGKWLVLDFWGTWCGWCVAGFPKMKDTYEKYTDKVEFVGIDHGDKEGKWREAIVKHELPWVQLRDDEDKIESTSVRYAVQSYPTKVIIDPNGIIRAIFKGESDDFYNKLGELLN